MRIPQLYFIFGWLQFKRFSVDSYSLQWGHSKLPLTVISLLAPVSNQPWTNFEIIVLADPDFALKAMENANQCILLEYSNAIFFFEKFFFYSVSWIEDFILYDTSLWMRAFPNNMSANKKYHAYRIKGIVR